MRPPIVGAAAVVAAALVWRHWLAPRHRRWGATDEELESVLPGDDLVAEPAFQLTRAITVEAPPEEVWPWIVQIGADRGGFYSYDRLENLFGLNIHSADEIVEEWQDLAVGDLISADRAGTAGWYVVSLHPHKALVLQVANLDTGRPMTRGEKLGWEFQWTFALLGTPTGATRLLVRERVAFDRAVTRAMLAPVGPVSFLMTRRMLLGIRSRIDAGRRPSS